MVPDMVLCMVSIMVRVLSMVAIICGNWASICGKSTSNWSRLLTRSSILTVIWSTPSNASNMDLNRPAEGDIEAVRFPVEIIADRPEEIVEIREMIPQFVRDILQLVRGSDHAMSVLTISCIKPYMRFMMTIVVAMSSACLSMSSMRSFWNGMFSSWLACRY